MRPGQSGLSVCELCLLGPARQRCLQALVVVINACLQRQGARGEQTGEVAVATLATQQAPPRVPPARRSASSPRREARPLPPTCVMRRRRRSSRSTACRCRFSASAAVRSRLCRSRSIFAQGICKDREKRWAQAAGSAAGMQHEDDLHLAVPTLQHAPLCPACCPSKPRTLSPPPPPPSPPTPPPPPTHPPTHTTKSTHLFKHPVCSLEQLRVHLAGGQHPRAQLLRGKHVTVHGACCNCRHLGAAGAKEGVGAEDGGWVGVQDWRTGAQQIVLNAMCNPLKLSQRGSPTPCCCHTAPSQSSAARRSQPWAMATASALPTTAAACSRAAEHA